MDEFKKWLHTVCFQAPPAHSYDLAKDAWVEAQKQERERIIALIDNSKTFYLADRFGVYAEPKIRKALEPK